MNLENLGDLGCRVLRSRSGLGGGGCLGLSGCGLGVCFWVWVWVRIRVKFVELVKKHELDISQPALSEDGGMTWEMTRRNENTEVHKKTEERLGWCAYPHLPPCAIVRFVKGNDLGVTRLSGEDEVVAIGGENKDRSGSGH
ncbi:hypothetical protein PHJA_002001600 [Phtheirospermum japonicum]|uniref:Uncharacterized protein n=1 Tax=Phtheirospermum japonicum TaxID=374723 RepID=A0A830CCU4_9LAMI|nr:hypothetical protein PHJA_002001600 [Phtheirospermum japonicum]